MLPTRDLAVGQTEGDPEMRPAPWFGRREAGFQRTTACLRHFFKTQEFDEGKI